MSETEALVRPVKCYFCEERMHYIGQPEHEPEVEITVESRDDESTFYSHIRCWNARIEQLVPTTP